MISSHQGHKIAEAFWRRLWLREVHLSSGLRGAANRWSPFEPVAPRAASLQAALGLQVQRNVI